MPMLSEREIEALKQKLPQLPLQKLRVKELQAAAYGLVGIRGKVKSVVVESIRDYLSEAPADDFLGQQMWHNLLAHRLLAEFTGTTTTPSAQPDRGMFGGVEAWSSSAVLAASASARAQAGARTTAGAAAPNTSLGVPGPTASAGLSVSTASSFLASLCQSHPLVQTSPGFFTPRSHLPTFGGLTHRVTTSASIPSFMTPTPRATAPSRPTPQPAVVSGASLRSAALACVPPSRVVGKFAFGPVRAGNDSRFHIASAAPSYDSLGRSCKHLLVVTALDPVSLSPLLRVPDGARIFLDGRAVRIPTSRVCAWDVSRITLRGSRCAPVELVVAFQESSAVVAAAVIEARSQLEDAAPMRALRFGVAHPAAAVLAMRCALRGSLPMPAIEAAGSGAALSSAENIRQAIASTGVLRGPTLWMAPSFREVIKMKEAEERRRLRRQAAAATAAATASKPSTQPSANGDAAVASDSDSDSDDDFMGAADEAVRVADPFRLNAIGVPVRGVACKHLSVFDAKTFEALSAHSTAPHARSCPFCKQPLQLADLRVDSALAAVLAAVRRGDTSGIIEDTVAAAFHQPGSVGASLATPELDTLLQAGSGVSPWLNAEAGVAVDKSRVHSVRLGADGRWQAVGLDGKDLSPMASKRQRSESGALADEDDEAMAKRARCEAMGGHGDDDDDDDDDDDEEEDLRRLVEELAGRSAAPDPVTPAMPTPSARADDEDDVIDLT